VCALSEHEITIKGLAAEQEILVKLANDAVAAMKLVAGAITAPSRTTLIVNFLSAESSAKGRNAFLMLREKLQGEFCCLLLSSFKACNCFMLF
jgi:hypothetical protein